MSKILLWKQIYFYIITIILYGFIFVSSINTDQLTICGPPSQNPRSLIFVSTLDGKISALDAANNGKKQWSLDMDESSMISSSIHRRELNDNGQWVRLIPSLSGGLYKFDGENLEKIPVTTEQLLSSSFRYSDNLVFSGGKETRSYGVSSKTGKILYECSISGCTNSTDRDTYVDEEIVVIQRYKQTVRAIEPRSGLEKWNFSVGQHELLLIPKENICHDLNNTNMPDYELKVIVPEGLIWAVKKNAPTVKLWQYKFDVPIVTIWQEEKAKSVDDKNKLKQVNLFDNSQWTWGSDFATGPSIYIGMHDRQIYIQENANIYKSFESSIKFIRQLQIPWEPYPAVDTALTSNLLSKEDNDKNSFYETEDEQSTTALSVLYNSEYINGNGFYLYAKEHLRLNGYNQSNNNNSKLLISDNVDDNCCKDFDDEYDIDEEYEIEEEYEIDDKTSVHVIIVSLWYWWKEVLVISITTALLLNFFWIQHVFNGTTEAKDAILPPLIVERYIESKSYKQTLDETQNVNFKSRYLTDFEPVDCLGKGGYGIVFEAKNKIDDCKYAIKRIALPNSQDSRERVMREVKALAKLDHCNIVRYFNAWLECPPSGWQKEHDEQWIHKQNFSSSGFPLELSQNESKVNTSTCIDVLVPRGSSIDKDDDSFIVFEDIDKIRNKENIIDINDSSAESFNLSQTTDNSSSSNNNNYHISKDCTSTGNNRQLCKMEDYKKLKKSTLSLNLNEKTVNCKSTKMFLYIQMQLCKRLSLREWLKEQSRPRDNHRILDIFHQIVDAVEYVHLQGLIHRDLKPSNIFFAFDDKVKIGDFGLATAMTAGYEEAHTPSHQNENINLKNSLHTAHVGTQLYMSPEQMNGQIYNYKVDIYSLGIIFFELLIPFTTEMERVIALKNLRKLLFPENFNMNYPAEHELLRLMLDERPEKRPTTVGIKAKPPLLNYEKEHGYSINESSKWHFELPQVTKHSSTTNSSSSSSSINSTELYNVF